MVYFLPATGTVPVKQSPVPAKTGYRKTVHTDWFR